MNSGTSALMMLCFALIACTREQNRTRTSASIHHICQFDVALESRLRQMTRDTIPNEEITIRPHKVNRLQRAISYYADLVGTLVGIALLVTVTAIWIAIGPSLYFDSSWWLIIGTYAGLIGMHDGFVLHNIQFQLNLDEESTISDVTRADADNLAIVALVRPPLATADGLKVRGITQTLSAYLSSICAHEYSVIFGIVAVLALLVVGTALKWSWTGQLLCNVPPSIIETFIMMTLITSHELDDQRQNKRLRELAATREMLTKWLDGAGSAEVAVQVPVKVAVAAVAAQPSVTQVED